MTIINIILPAIIPAIAGMARSFGRKDDQVTLFHQFFPGTF